MGYPLREILPEKVYHVSNRAIESQFLLLPEDGARAIMGEWLARGTRMFDIKLIDFTFQSNHFHIVCSCPEANLDDFMRYFQSRMAWFLNLYWGRTGTVFPRRYSKVDIVDDKALIEVLIYIHTNATRNDLVDRVEDWPGVTSAPASLFGEKIEFEAFYRTEYHNAGRPQDRSAYREKIEIVLAPPPCWEHLSPEERRGRLLDLVRAREEMFRLERKRKRKRVLGRSKVLAHCHTHRPKETKRTPRPLCHASTREDRDEYRQHRIEFCAAFKEASQRFLDGDLEAEFPPGSFPPRMPRVA